MMQQNPDRKAFDLLSDSLREHGFFVRERSSGKATAQCPAHDDKNPSMSINERRDGRGVVIHCHAGCHWESVLSVLGLNKSDLFDEPLLKGAFSERREYVYPGGRRVHRTPGKRFSQAGDTQDRSLFGSNRVGSTSTTVYVVEGEKDVEVLEAIGATAVSAPMGAGTAASRFDWSPLTGRDVIVIVDKDEPGRRHANQLRGLLSSVVSSVTFKEALTGKDAADHVAAGHSLDELVDVVLDIGKDRAGAVDVERLWRRESLRQIRDFARARRVSPEATLGVAMVKAVCQIPAHVVIPPLVGGPSAVNLFLALTGPSGAGKGGAEAAGMEAVLYVGDGANEDIPMLNVGSGEGIARTFDDTNDNPTKTAIFTCSEVDTVGALFGRKGATLEPEIRKLWMGERLGFTNANRHTRTDVKKLTYRAGLIFGVQPRRSRPLFEGADGGTPQRILWLPVLDHEMPLNRPEPVQPLIVRLPEWPEPAPMQFGVFYLEVPEEAKAAIDAHQVAVHRDGVDPMNGHSLLCRLKAAAALMVLDGRQSMTVDDWELAGLIMELSDATRWECQAALQAQSRDQRSAQAAARAEQEELISDKRLERCKRSTLTRVNKLREGEIISGSALRRSLREELRGYFEPAAAQLLDEGRLVTVPLKAGGTGYTRRTPVHPRTPEPTCANTFRSTGVPPYTPASENNGTNKSDDGEKPAQNPASGEAPGNMSLRERLGFGPAIRNHSEKTAPDPVSGGSPDFVSLKDRLDARRREAEQDRANQQNGAGTKDAENHPASTKSS